MSAIIPNGPSVLERFEQALYASGRSRHTRSTYAGALRGLSLHLSRPLDERFCLEVSVAELRAFVDRGRVAGTRAGRTSALRAFFRWARGAGLRPDDPGEDLEHEPRPRPVREALSRDQLEAYVARVTRAGSVRDIALIRLLAETGALPSEIEALNVSDVCFAGAGARVRIRGTRARTLPIPPTTAAALRLWLAQRGTAPGALFTSFRGQRLEPHSIGKRLNRYQLDVPVTARILRATFAFLALEDGVALEDLKRRLGHTVASTTLLNQLARWRQPTGARRGGKRGPPRRR